MTLDRTLVSIDVESTGLSATNDRIISLGIATVEGAAEFLFDPQVPIPKEASDIHGITDEMVNGKPTFKDGIPLFMARLTGAVRLVGYNLRGFDIQIIQAELARAGYHKEWPEPGMRVFDACNIFKMQNPRDLTAACKHYLKREPSGAHGASEDAADTLAVFSAQLVEHTELGAMTPDQLHEYCAQGAADWAGKLKWDEQKRLCYAFGEQRGKTVESDTGFANWILKKDFPENTKQLIRVELKRIQEAEKGMF